MPSPTRADVAAREARERCESRADRCDACAMHAELYRSGYRLSALAEPSSVIAKPVKLRARYAGNCAACGAPIDVDDPVWWTRGAQGVECAGCGSRP